MIFRLLVLLLFQLLLILLIRCIRNKHIDANCVSIVWVPFGGRGLLWSLMHVSIFGRIFMSVLLPTRLNYDPLTVFCTSPPLVWIFVFSMVLIPWTYVAPCFPHEVDFFDFKVTWIDSSLQCFATHACCLRVANWYGSVEVMEFCVECTECLTQLASAKVRTTQCFACRLRQSGRLAFFWDRKFVSLYRLRESGVRMSVSSARCVNTSLRGYMRFEVITATSMEMVVFSLMIGAANTSETSASL